MAVTSTTLSGVNVWRFSGAVTDAEIKTAWAGLIVNNRYRPNRTIYIDDTCSLLNVRGTYYVDCENLGIILHLSRNKADTLFSNWVLTQTVGLSVGARSNFIRFTNGTTITNSTVDGIDMKGGAMIYGVIGNPGGGDPRFLNEMMFGSLDGTVVTSAAWTEQEIEPTSIGTIWKGLNVQKAAGYPILSNNSGTQRQVIYRSAFNTENATLRLIRPYYNNSVCYVSSTIRRQGAFVGPNMLDTFGSNGGCVIMILNNWRDESWFGVARTNFGGANWNGGNRIIGGVMKKIKVEPSTIIRTYDSRSTTVSQKSTFSETTQDFLAGTDSTIADPITGQAQFVCVGAIATGGSIAITRYTGQKFTLQKFGYRVQVIAPDMDFGDDDLSAFSPITMVAQLGMARTQAQIQAATGISNYKEVLEELHNLAVTSLGASSYDAPFGGNFFELNGRALTTDFAEIVIDPNATSKIAYNGVINTLTIKSSIISSTTDVNEWRNEGGTFTFLNGSQINGVFADNDGSRVNVFNLDPENFGITWFLRYKKTSDTAWIELSGTGNSTTILADLDEYDMMFRVPGYQWKEIVFDTNESLSIDANLSYHVSANNTPQYTMSFNANLESKINFDPVANSVSVENETGVITQPGFAELYQATERIQHLPALVWTFNAPITANSTSQKILIPNGNPITFFLTEGSNASVKVTCPVIHADTGESADDRVRGNSDGFSIILGSPATAESAGLQSAIVSDILAKIGGVGYSIENDNLQKINEKVQTLENTDLTGIATTDNVNDVLDAVNNIEPTDISALALEASVQQSLTAIDLTLKDADYVEPDNTTIGQIKTKVDTLENYDDTATQTKLDTLQTTVDNIDVDFTPVLDAIDLTLKETDYTAPDNATIAEIQTKVDTLENTDITPILEAVEDNFEVTKIISVEVQKLN